MFLHQNVSTAWSVFYSKTLDPTKQSFWLPYQNHEYWLYFKITQVIKLDDGGQKHTHTHANNIKKGKKEKEQSKRHLMFTLNECECGCGCDGDWWCACARSFAYFQTLLAKINSMVRKALVEIRLMASFVCFDCNKQFTTIERSCASI